MKLSLRVTGLMVVAIAACTFLSSCLGVDVATKFNKDNSGTMTMKLRISQMLIQMGEEQGSPPVPLTKEDLEKAYESLDGVKVESVEQENTDQDRIITSTISFKSFAVFQGTKDLAGTGARLTKEDGRTVYRVLVGEKEPAPADVVENAPPAPSSSGDSPSGGEASQEPDESMKAMIKGLMAGYSIKYAVTAPTTIVSHTIGEVSPDGKTVTYSIPMSDYMDLKEPIQFEVKW
jgi:hypothetical protein